MISFHSSAYKSNQVQNCRELQPSDCLIGAAEELVVKSNLPIPMITKLECDSNMSKKSVLYQEEFLKKKKKSTIKKQVEDENLLSCDETI